MSEVKWIKLSTHMFEDEKIKLIEQMPESDTLLIIWVKLLTQAGKTNASGYIFLSENIPYTEEMLAAIFNRPIPIVRLALKTFEQFGMIEINENQFISICNWEKHQNIQGMDKIREQNRLRKQRQRDKQKFLQIPNNSHVKSRDSHVIDKEKELDIDKEKDNIPFKLIIDFLNKVAEKNFRETTQKTKDLIKARWNEGFKFEDFKQVILVKSNEWRNTDMVKFLRPETLFGTKFESYLNQKGGSQFASNQGSVKDDDYDDLPF
ncbi:phage replisome organizer N-terminal domain-containing protein [Bacillus gobiensis]|uniref:Replication protein n=1 Tax=Bacillus gobiensis TaxID=1441095 RepID=A0A0M4FNH0_9BACI|nr:phage replisome organizer N-terminal domain-containing protein [Bacillus gobiensis]ALC80423.1 replication protein [Bacillus gobiensis]